MFERVLLLAAAALVLVLAVVVVRKLVARRTEARLGQTLPEGTVAPEGPALLYFYGAACAACETQKRALEELSVPVVAVDAAREPELAAWAGVMTVPSTAVVDRARRLRAVNHGFTPAEALRGQLETLAS